MGVTTDVTSLIRAAQSSPKIGHTRRLGGGGTSPGVRKHRGVRNETNVPQHRCSLCSENHAKPRSLRYQVVTTRLRKSSFQGCARCIAPLLGGEPEGCLTRYDPETCWARSGAELVFLVLPLAENRRRVCAPKPIARWPKSGRFRPGRAPASTLGVPRRRW